MPSRGRTLEDAIVVALGQRLEEALDLTIRHDAATQFEAIARLCEEARVLAESGVLLLADRS